MKERVAAPDGRNDSGRNRTGSSKPAKDDAGLTYDECPQYYLAALGNLLLCSGSVPQLGGNNKGISCDRCSQ